MIEVITIIVVMKMISVEELFGVKVNVDQQKFLKVISRNGVSDILFSLERGPQRFSQLMFETKLNPGILDRHLKALLEFNLIIKNSETYELTDSGRRLIAILQQLFRVLK
ncbi:MAG: ArsR family transcriptional regulator [Archaeoglobaceae archaeon]|nr:ArsR family transcriptional regulator [Archaeoglobaceae archaeon]MDW8128602.1 ArsR family transcriptional regulator [Archaeoglobaceae archaeon]